MIKFYRRIYPRLSIVRLVSARSRSRKPVYIGFRVNLIWWSLEIVRGRAAG